MSMDDQGNIFEVSINIFKAFANCKAQVGTINSALGEDMFADRALPSMLLSQTWL